MTLDGGGVKAGDFEDPPMSVAYALLDMGGKVSGICCCCCFERLNSQKRVLFVLVVLGGGLILSMGLFDR
jgi:hypothetical protein